jgi:hypothetical protein
MPPLRCHPHHSTKKAASAWCRRSNTSPAENESHSSSPPGDASTSARRKSHRKIRPASSPATAVSPQNTPEHQDFRNHLQSRHRRRRKPRPPLFAGHPLDTRRVRNHREACREEKNRQPTCRRLVARPHAAAATEAAPATEPPAQKPQRNHHGRTANDQSRRCPPPPRTTWCSVMAWLSRRRRPPRKGRRAGVVGAAYVHRAQADHEFGRGYQGDKEAASHLSSVKSNRTIHLRGAPITSLVHFSVNYVGTDSSPDPEPSRRRRSYRFRSPRA